MITKEKIEKILKATLRTRVITTTDLKQAELTSYDINTLIEKQKLARIERGKYQWIEAEELYKYGKRLIAEEKFEEAANCFQICYELEPENPKICFQMFYKAMVQEHYEEAISFYRQLKGNLEEQGNELDLKICMLLLNELADLSEDMKEQLNAMRYKEVISISNQPDFHKVPLSQLSEDDQLRSYIYRQRYDIAYSVLGRLEEKYLGLNPWKNTIKLLLNRVLIFRNVKTLRLAQAKDYEGLIAHLEVLVRRNPKDKEMSYVLALAQDRMEMEKTGHIPSSTFVETNQVYQALEHKSYKQAKSIIEFTKVKQRRIPNTALIYLLDDMISAMEEKRKEEATIPNILLYLRKEDLDTAFGLLRTYLEQIGKKEYESVVIELIKVGYQEPDAQFRKAFGLVNNEQINVSSYALFCYEALAIKDYDLANSYINVLIKLRELGHTYPMLDHLIEMKERLTNPVNMTVPPKAKIDSMTTASREIPRTVTSQAIPSKQPKAIEGPKSTDMAMLESKAEELSHGCKIILLKTMSHARRKGIYTLIKRNFPNMRGYGIGTDPEWKRLLLKEHSKEKINIAQVRREGNEAYQEGDFYNCIKNYHLLLVHTEQPRPDIYAKLGLAYMRKFSIKKAILYLTIANELYKTSHIPRDFTELIERLQGNITKEEKKPFVTFREEEFRNDINDYYGLEAVEEMALLVTNGESLKEVADKFHLNDEQLCFLKLIFARNCYANEEYELGDFYLKSAEQMKQKPKQAQQLLEEIRRNKRFYKNRKQEGAKTFALTK